MPTRTASAATCFRVGERPSLDLETRTILMGGSFQPNYMRWGHPFVCDKDASSKTAHYPRKRWRAPGHAVGLCCGSRMDAIIRNVLLVFAALLPIVNPLGMAPIFAEMTLGYDTGIRRTVAMRVAVNGVVLLVASLFIGSYILQFFGISLAAVQIGGGLVVTVAGWRILNRKGDPPDRQAGPQPSNQQILSQAFYPLTMPLTVGPGSIVSAMAAVIGILLIGVSIYLCYGYANRLERLLGPNGSSIVIRLSAFIVMC